MNRRNFFRCALGALGATLLVGSIEPVEDIRVLTRIYPMGGYEGNATLSLADDTGSFTWRIVPDYTHQITPYHPEVFDLPELA